MLSIPYNVKGLGFLVWFANVELMGLSTLNLLSKTKE